MDSHKVYLIALSLIKRLGPVRTKDLVAYAGGVKEVFALRLGKLKRIPGIGEKTARLILASDTIHRAEKELRYAEGRGIRVLSYLEESYPNRLRYIHDAPLVLYLRGGVDLNAQDNIAIVGTRRATAYGREMAISFGEYLGSRGINVVSGLAYGIDIAAHKGTLGVEGVTTAVLAHGLDRLYPQKHLAKAKEMIAKGGLLTEYLPGTNPDAPNFPARNRIISGVCRAVIVVEAAERGGALITARNAFDQNREVYAMPGNVGSSFSVGCNRLIRDNIAKLITSPQEVLDDLEIRWQESENKLATKPKDTIPADLALSVDEGKVMNLLTKGDAVVDNIATKMSLSMSKLMPLLLAMEFKELIRQLPGKKFQRV